MHQHHQAHEDHKQHEHHAQTPHQQHSGHDHGAHVDHTGHEALFRRHMLTLLLVGIGVLLVSACQPADAPAPKPTATYDYSLLPPRTTPVPLTPAPTATPGGAVRVSFRRDILPILEQNCVRCHGGDEPAGDRRFDRLAMAIGDDGS
ncbi:MAG: hypothetical protein D6802_09480, partial [Ardenticatenia bacterium]